jgi:hypothetical protein
VLARHSDSMPVLVDLFREHRSARLAAAREFVHVELPKHDVSAGLIGLPEDERILVRDLAWYYDNLGALVAHGVVDIAPVSGYLGGAVLKVWEDLHPLVEAERGKRVDRGADPQRWQIYFENLYHLVKAEPPQRARAKQKLWRLGQ